MMMLQNLNKIFKLCLLNVVMLAMAIPASAAIESVSEFVIIMDYDSGNVLFEKNADAPMKPASMAKMMTTYILFKDLKNGHLSLDDNFLVSRKAYRSGGSRMFLEQNDEVSVEDLLRGVIVQSGNDASIVIAEGLTGSEEAFAEEMTKQAKELGMSNTVFGNSTGWPDEKTTTTVRDMAILARALIDEFPEYYKIYGEKSFEYNNIKQDNRNPLLYTMNGADGLKTGHTEESGFGLVGSAEINGQRIIMVVNGLNSDKQRRLESTRLMQEAFRIFRKYDLLVEGEILGHIPLKKSVEEALPLTVAATVSQVLDRKTHQAITRRTDWPNSVKAPITKGQKLGQIFLTIDGVETAYPLVAAKDIELLPLHKRVLAFFEYLVFGADPSTQAQ